MPRKRNLTVSAGKSLAKTASFRASGAQFVAGNVKIDEEGALMHTTCCPPITRTLSLVTLLLARQAPSFALLLLVIAHPSVVHNCSFSTAPLHTRRRYPRQGEELLRHQVCRPGGPKDDWARRLLCRQRGHAQVYRSQVCHEVHQHVRQVQTKPAAVRAAHTVRIALHTRAEYVGWGQGRTHLPQTPQPPCLPAT